MTMSILALYLVGGCAAGALYFGSLWWNARLFERAAGLRAPIAAIAARFVLLGGVLTAVSLEGAAPLLATAVGLLIARTAVLRRIRAGMA